MTKIEAKAQTTWGHNLLFILPCGSKFLALALKNTQKEVSQLFDLV